MAKKILAVSLALGLAIAAVSFANRSEGTGLPGSFGPGRQRAEARADRQRRFQEPDPPDTESR